MRNTQTLVEIHNTQQNDASMMLKCMQLNFIEGEIVSRFFTSGEGALPWPQKENGMKYLKNMMIGYFLRF